MNRHDHVLLSFDDPRDGSLVGRFAEALVRYDRVSLLSPDPAPLATLLDWFVAPGEIETLLIWLRDAVVDFIDVGGDFRARVLDDPAVARVMQGQYRHSRLKHFGRVRGMTLSTQARGPAAALEAACALGTDVSFSHASGADARHLLAGLPGFQTFEASVQFPAVRRRVDEGRMDLRAVIALRRESRPIRAWLQAADRGPMQQLVALHDRIGRALGETDRSVLSLYGDLHRAVQMPKEVTDVAAEEEGELAPGPPWRTAFAHDWRPILFDAG